MPCLCNDEHVEMLVDDGATQRRALLLSEHALTQPSDRPLEHQLQRSNVAPRHA